MRRGAVMEPTSELYVVAIALWFSYVLYKRYLISL